MTENLRTVSYGVSRELRVEASVGTHGSAIGVISGKKTLRCLVVTND